MIKDLFAEKKKNNEVVISFEIFPPKKESNIEAVYKTIEGLKNLKPDFVSVTYGAGGSNSKLTLQIVDKLQNQYKLQALAHFTCVNANFEKISEMLNAFQKVNVSNILALRGDPPLEDLKFDWTKQEYCYAGDLVRHLKNDGRFSIAAATYPEGHVECRDLDKDIEHLEKKVRCGVDFLITQLFFDNSIYYRFLEKVRAKGINIPITVGVMPVLNTKQISRIVALCGASIPLKLATIIAKYEHDDQSMEKAGIEYAVNQIEDLVKNQAEGIHLYTMNKVEQVKLILSALKGSAINV